MDFYDLIGLYYDEEDFIDKNLYINKSKIRGAGEGLFTSTEFAEGRIVGIYDGKRFSPQKVLSGAAQRYVFHYDRGDVSFLVVPFTNNKMRYINDIVNVPLSIRQQVLVKHPIEYNVDWCLFDREIYIVAKRDIRSGEELYIDYGNGYWDHLIDHKRLSNKIWHRIRHS